MKKPNALLMAALLGAVLNHPLTSDAQEAPKAISQIWDSATPFPSSAEAPLLKGVTFHIIKPHEPKVDGYHWMHGASIIHHKGTWYFTWGHNEGRENTATEVTQGRRSSDDFATLTPVEMIAPGTDKWGNSHGVTLSYDGELWGFFGRFTGSRTDVRTDIFKLNETTDKWESLNQSIGDFFWATGEPQRMDNGNIIMAGFRMRPHRSRYSPPAVAISNGDDLMDWTVVRIAGAPNLLTWGECGLIIRGEKLILVSRHDKSDAMAYVAVSEDYGKTWSDLQRSNMPMAATKPYTGTLSTGRDYLISTTTSDAGNLRRPLTIALTEPGGEPFNTVYRIRDGVRPGEGKTSQADLAYPYAMEHDGRLYVVYSVGRPGNTKNTLELAIVPLSSLTGGLCQ